MIAMPTPGVGAVWKMLREIHGVMQEPDELRVSHGVDTIEENVARWLTALADVQAANAGAEVVARLTAKGIARDGDKSLFDHGRVRARLLEAPSRLRVSEHIDDVALRPRRADDPCHAPAL